MQHNQEETHTVALPCRREHELVRTFVIHCQTDIDFDSMGFFIPLVRKFGFINSIDKSTKATSDIQVYKRQDRRRC